jgi:hypothetical protein
MAFLGALMINPRPDVDNNEIAPYPETNIRYCGIFPLEYEGVQEKPSCRNEHAFSDAKMKLLGTF